MPNSIAIRINKPMQRHNPGDVVVVPTFDDGTPTGLFWRRRIRDSKIDGCVTILQPDPAAVQTEAAYEVPVEASASES